MADALKVLYLSTEILPYAATGGLGQVAAVLPRALRAQGTDVRVMLPRYGVIDPQRLGFKRIPGTFDVPFGQGIERAALWQAPDSDLPIYFIENQRFFGDRQGLYAFADDGERFVFYSRASLEAARHLDWAPDVVHCNEWQTALIPNWLRTRYQQDPFFARTAVVYTIHNLSYQGIFGRHELQVAGLEQQGFIVHPDVVPSLNQVLSMMGRGIIFADIITTVSPTYAQEIQTAALGEGLEPLLQDRREHLVGILNGLDNQSWNPATDKALPMQFSTETLEGKQVCKRALQAAMGLPKDDGALIGMTSRLIDPKGFDILSTVLEPMLRLLPAQWVIMGSGDDRYHHLLADLQQRYPQRLRFAGAYDEALSRRIYGGSDIFLMPSRHEPGGLDQLKGMRYGAVPVVHATGGLKDTVINHSPPEIGTGVCFERYDAMDLYAAVVRALELYQHPHIWQEIQRQGMHYRASVTAAARAYVQVYQQARAAKKPPPVFMT